MFYKHDTWEELWRFETERFKVILDITDEDSHPADSHEFQEDIDAILTGKVHWFVARVRVMGPHGDELGCDILGACAYAKLEDFYTAHRDIDPTNRNCSIMRAQNGDNAVIGHYFPGMVRDAIQEARETLNNYSEIASTMRKI